MYICKPEVEFLNRPDYTKMGSFQYIQLNRKKAHYKSAFTLFFYLEQSCLRDTIGQNNGMLVMVLPPNSTATNRAKREVDMDMGSREKEDSVTALQNWNDFDVSTDTLLYFILYLKRY